jgi:16S rRNA (cytosine1402-N4)-methyltransferase
LIQVPVSGDDQLDRLNHQSVLYSESLDLLNIRSGLTYIDATVGAGGHLKGIVQALSAQEQVEGASEEKRQAGQTELPHESASLHGVSSSTRTTSGVIGIDRDSRSLDLVRARIQETEASLFHANYTDIKEVVKEAGLSTVTGGILADLGVSSMQLDQPERGFSFQKDGPLDMRMDETQSFSAYDIVNKWDEKKLADIIYEYGEERQSRAVARNIVNARPLKTTLELAEVVSRAVRRPMKYNRHTQTIHPATRTFQALRIAVNDELGGLKTFLDEAIELLAPGARIVVITFHSLEDRMVKQNFRHHADACHCPPRQPVCNCGAKSELLIITKKPIIADEKEVLANMRSRSAKLRAGEKIG